MTTEQQKALTKAEERSDVGFILSKSGVMVVGSDLLGDKLTAILLAAIELDDLHGLACLTIREDGFPTKGTGDPVFGMAYADTNSMAINLDHCWHRACVKAHKNDVNLSFMGILWVNILNTLAHELDHLTIANNDREMYEGLRSSEDGLAELEESAKAAGEPMMIALALGLDIEIPAAADLGWIGVKLMDLFTNESTKELEWVIKARKDIEAGIIYAEPENNIEMKTFREFVKKGFAGDSTDAGWEQATTAVNLTAYLDSGVVKEFKAEPVEEAVIETVVLEAEEVPAEAVAMSAASAPMFLGAGEAGEPDIVLTDTHIGAGANQALQNEVIQKLMDGPNPQPITPAVVVGTQEYVAEHAKPGDTVEVLDVPLPAAVAAQAATTTAAAATAVAPTQETPTTYTPNTIAPEVQAAVMQDVWKLLYHHVFTKCGWQQNPQTGRFMFTNAAAVLEGVNIQSVLTKYSADNFIMEYDTLDAEGKYAAEMCQGMIRGRTTSKQGLPSYALYLNINGQRIKRSFIPQNPEKMTNNAYTKSADEAAGGHMIVWVFKDEVADGAPFSQKCAVTIKDNVYEIMS